MDNSWKEKTCETCEFRGKDESMCRRFPPTIKSTCATSYDYFPVVVAIVFGGQKYSRACSEHKEAK